MNGRALHTRLVDPSRSRPANRAARRALPVAGGDGPAVTVGKLGVWTVAGLLRLAARFPRTTLTLLAGLVLVDRAGLVAPGLGLLVAVLTGLTWRGVHPVSYRRCVGGRLRAWRRRWFRYAPRWAPLMARTGLTLVDGDVAVWPGLRGVRSTPWRDSLLVRLRHGQTPADVEAATEPLAHALHSVDVRVRVHAPGLVWVDVLTRDPLHAPIPALPVPALDGVDLTGLPVGRREDGALWRLAVLGTHVLLTGATGSGKGSVIWSVLRAMAPAIHTGLVQVWAIDPKGGMELFPGRALFTRYEDGTVPAMVDLLEEAAVFTRQRAARLKGTTRRLTPTVDDPFVLVLVDEFAFLTAYQTDRKLVERADTATQILCSQGRAPGVGLLAAVQDPAKDIISYRNLFPTRIALRLDEPQQVDMVLGAGARARGAYCDRISAGLPGVGYVKVDGVREPVRVRAAYPDDDDIAGMVFDYPAPVGGPVLLDRSTPCGLTVAADVPAYLTDDELSPEWQAFTVDYQNRHVNGKETVR